MLGSLESSCLLTTAIPSHAQQLRSDDFFPPLSFCISQAQALPPPCLPGCSWPWQGCFTLAFLESVLVNSNSFRNSCFGKDGELILLLDAPAKPGMTKLDIHSCAWENPISLHFIFSFFLLPKGEGGNKFSSYYIRRKKKEGSTPFPSHCM